MYLRGKQLQVAQEGFCTTKLLIATNFLKKYLASDNAETRPMVHDKLVWYTWRINTDCLRKNGKILNSYTNMAWNRWTWCYYKWSVCAEMCHPCCAFKLYGEVNSIKNTTTNVWLNDGAYYQWKNYMFRPIAAIFILTSRLQCDYTI